METRRTRSGAYIQKKEQMLKVLWLEKEHSSYQDHRGLCLGPSDEGLGRQQ